VLDHTKPVKVGRRQARLIVKEFSMSRGKPTDKRLANKAKAIVAKTGDVQLASDKTGIPERTVRDIVSDEQFAEFRRKIEREQITKLCQISMGVADLLERKINEMFDQDNLKDVRIKELTGAVKELRDTVKEVKDNSINVENATFVVKWGDDD
jgi:hypothetical protein